MDTRRDSVSCGGGRQRRAALGNSARRPQPAVDRIDLQRVLPRGSNSVTTAVCTGRDCDPSELRRACNEVVTVGAECEEEASVNGHIYVGRRVAEHPLHLYSCNDCIADTKAVNCRLLVQLRLQLNPFTKRMLPRLRTRFSTESRRCRRLQNYPRLQNCYAAL